MKPSDVTFFFVSSRKPEKGKHKKRSNRGSRQPLCHAHRSKKPCESLRCLPLPPSRSPTNDNENKCLILINDWVYSASSYRHFPLAPVGTASLICCEDNGKRAESGPTPSLRLATGYSTGRKENPVSGGRKKPAPPPPPATVSRAPHSVQPSAVQSSPETERLAKHPTQHPLVFFPPSIKPLEIIKY